MPIWRIENRDQVRQTLTLPVRGGETPSIEADIVHENAIIL